MTSKNEIPVKIHVETVHRQDGQKEEYAEDFDGRLIEIGETVYLRYEEELPENEHAKVTFKIAGDEEVQLTRKLEHQKLHLTFKPGKRIPSRYQTPYGNIPVEAFAGRMETVLEDDPHHLFKGEPVFFVHRQQERRERHRHHQEHGSRVADGAPGQQIGRDAHRRRDPETHKLTFRQVKGQFGLDFG